MNTAYIFCYLYILLIYSATYIFCLYILPYLVYLGCDFFGPITVLTSTLHVIRAGVHSWDMHRPYYNIITNFNSKQSLKWFQLYNTRFRDLQSSLNIKSIEQRNQWAVCIIQNWKKGSRTKQIHCTVETLNDFCSYCYPK